MDLPLGPVEFVVQAAFAQQWTVLFRFGVGNYADDRAVEDGVVGAGERSDGHVGVGVERARGVLAAQAGVAGSRGSRGGLRSGNTSSDCA